MIDWPGKIAELKQMADELELQASRAQDRSRLVLGRMADELRQFVGQLEQALADPDDQAINIKPIPEWLQAPAIDEYEGISYEGGYVEDNSGWNDPYDEQTNLH